MNDNKATKRGADLRIPRRATAVAGDGTQDTRPLEQWGDVDAYVLLGDPGAGKSEALNAESKACGGYCISAGDFITLGVPPTAVGRTLFIDGLDEVRARVSDGRVPLDAIRVRLKDLEYPRFRLSCREHDWRAQSDETALQMVARGGSVRVLHLEPLSPEEQREILQARSEEVRDANEFLQQAERHGLSNLFGNPLLLDLTIRAVAAQGGWPESRRQVYELACRELAAEHSVARREVSPLQPGDIDALLDDAGLLCAFLLLGGKGSITNALEESSDSAFAWHELPADMRFHDARAALGSKVFSATADGFAPRHRSIAEFLAAQAIAKRIRNGLPLGRVLALMTGRDGRVVEPLRGLLGWLAVHDSVNRQQLIRLDPLSVVLNGDVGAFVSDDKRILLQALRDEAQRNRWFRNGQWVSHPFAPLATLDMAAALHEILADHAVDGSHQALVDCVLDALRHGARMPQLGKALEEWVEDSGACIENRTGALKAWKNTVDFDPHKAKYWLLQLREGRIPDVDGRLTGALLADLYPDHVEPEEVLNYWPRSGDIRTNTQLPDFWWRGLIRRTRPRDFATLIDAWLHLQPKARDSHHVNEWARVCSDILAGALENSGDLVDDARLYAWLGIGIGEHDFSVIRDGKLTERIAGWLSDHPDRIKAVTRLCWSSVEPDPRTGQRYYWAHTERMYGARLPRDWLQWLLQQAAEAPNDELAYYCFRQVAGALVQPPPGFDLPTMEQVETWVEEHRHRWSQAGEWLQRAWSSQLEDNWQGDAYRRNRKHEVETLKHREARKKVIAPQVNAVVTGTASPGLMNQIALAHEERFRDIRGDTPEARVQDYLVTDEVTARYAINGLTRVLEREDMPSVDEILRLEAKGKEHYLRLAALVAARLVHLRSPVAVDQWPDSLLEKLTAFWLTDGTGNTPDWYEHAAKSRSAVVAPILVRYALPRLRRKGPLFVAGLWSASSEPEQASLARLVLPPLLEGFPLRASEDARRVLNQSLLGALHVLDDDTAADIVRRRLGKRSMDAVQRVCWLVANLPYRAGAVQTLINAVGQNCRRLTALGVALHEQNGLGRALKDANAATLSRLIELLAPISEPEWESEGGWVRPTHERRDTVRSLIRLLENNSAPAAGEELQRLSNLPRLQPWADQLRYSLISQQGVSREAHYVHPIPRTVALTMANLGPANHADLKALTLDHLRDIEQQLRGSDTFALKLLWKEGSNSARVPKIENDCRDLLLERLRVRLRPFDVHVIPERRAADEKRVDLRIEFASSGQQVVMPIEIKKEDSKELWSAWRDQLQRLYAIDPEAAGNGIYIALWFGHKPKSSPEGVKPVSAEDLQRILTERIPEADRSQIAVCVLDLSLPAPNPAVAPPPHP